MNYLSVSDLGHYIYKSESWIYKMVRVNQIPFYKVGNRLLFQQTEIDNWIQKGSLPEVRIPDLPNF